MCCHVLVYVFYGSFLDAAAILPGRKAGSPPGTEQYNFIAPLKQPPISAQLCKGRAFNLLNSGAAFFSRCSGFNCPAGSFCSRDSSSFPYKTFVMTACGPPGAMLSCIRRQGVVRLIASPAQFDSLTASATSSAQRSKVFLTLSFFSFQQICLARTVLKNTIYY